MSLRGKTILITRSKEQAKDFIEIIESKGGKAISFPTISIEDPDSWNECDDAINNISTFNGIIFTSQNAVRKFLERLSKTNSALTPLHSLLIFAVGENTKIVLEKHNLKVTAMPQQFTAESLAERMKDFGISGKIFLYPRGNLGREAIVDMLTSFGAKVKTVTVYKTTKPDPVNVDMIEKKILEGKIDIVSFMSPSTVKNFFSLFTEEAKSVFGSKTVFAVIGGVTSAAMLKLGLSPSITAEPSTVEGMINAIENYYKNRKI